MQNRFVQVIAASTVAVVLLGLVGCGSGGGGGSDTDRAAAGPPLSRTSVPDVGPGIDGGGDADEPSLEPGPRSVDPVAQEDSVIHAPAEPVGPAIDGGVAVELLTQEVGSWSIVPINEGGPTTNGPAEAFDPGVVDEGHDNAHAKTVLDGVDVAGVGPEIAAPATGLLNNHEDLLAGNDAEAQGAGLVEAEGDAGLDDRTDFAIRTDFHQVPGTNAGHDDAALGQKIPDDRQSDDITRAVDGGAGAAGPGAGNTLAIAMPEPATVVLVILGLAASLQRRRRAC